MIIRLAKLEKFKIILKLKAVDETQIRKIIANNLNRTFGDNIRRFKYC
jgi:hypothetical protein